MPRRGVCVLAMETDKEKHVALARQAIEQSGAGHVVIDGLRRVAQDAGIPPEEVFGRLDTLMDLWIEAASEVWRDLFSTEQIEALIAWQSSSAGVAMLEKQADVQALGAQIMEQVIAQNTGGAL